MAGKSKGKRFANQAEEAAWWEANEEVAANSFERDLNAGYVGPCVLVVTGDSTAAKIRLGSRDIAKMRVQAAERGLCSQTYLKMIVREALTAAESGRKSVAK